MYLMCSNQLLSYLFSKYFFRLDCKEFIKNQNKADIIKGKSK